MNELKLHDIKSLVEIPDYSLYLFIGVIVLAIVLIACIIYALILYFKRPKENPKKLSYQILCDIDFTKTKQNAYTITKHGRIVATGEREKRLLEELINDLEQYKYTKEVKPFSKQSQQLFEQFMESLDVK